MKKHFLIIVLSQIISITFGVFIYFYLWNGVMEKAVVNPFLHYSQKAAKDIQSVINQETSFFSRLPIDDNSEEMLHRIDNSYYHLAFDEEGKITKVFPPLKKLLGNIVPPNIMEKAKYGKPFMVGYNREFNFLSDDVKVIVPYIEGGVFKGGSICILNRSYLFEELQEGFYSDGCIFLVDENGIILTQPNISDIINEVTTVKNGITTFKPFITKYLDNIKSENVICFVKIDKLTLQCYIEPVELGDTRLYVFSFLNYGKRLIMTYNFAVYVYIGFSIAAFIILELFVLLITYIHKKELEILK